MSGNGRVSRAEMKRIDLALLRYISKQAPQGESVELSVRAMGRVLQCSEFRVKSASVRLEGDGLIQRQARFGSDGGRRANAYCLTPSGWELLESMQAEQSQQNDITYHVSHFNQADSGASSDGAAVAASASYHASNLHIAQLPASQAQAGYVATRSEGETTVQAIVMEVNQGSDAGWQVLKFWLAESPRTHKKSDNLLLSVHVPAAAEIWKPFMEAYFCQAFAVLDA